MAHPKEIKGTIALLGAAAAAVVAVLLGVLYWSWSGKPETSQNTAPAQTAQPSAPSQTAPGQQAATKPAAPSEAPAAQPKDASIAPSFDLVRVEPDGESVIAGRAAPGATIELLRGDQVHARAAADASGLFAIVPPPLPPGSHLVVLQSIAPDGTRQRSAQSVTVVITDAKTRPLVTLTAPDKPTVVLSNPEPPAKVAEEPKPDTKTAEAQPAAPQPAQPAPQQQAGAAPTVSPPPAPAQPAPRPEIKIVTVEAEEGKLFVSGQSAPGATVRLYLNESLIAPGGAGSDGKVSFSIGSGVKPGDYRIRLDDVDPVSGQVRSRAEVGFNVPVQVASAQPQGPASSQPTAPTAQSQASQDVASAMPHGQVAGAGTVVIPNINTTIVSRGDNLWRISQRVYGKGLRYTVIYGANQEQIRNPDLIYPGQVFVLPGEQEPKSN
ncbi:LysM peptidoglycan-binding domain-containing protein [Microvirga sp. VF16]|uniref:LysM peptidoglycan-binding domain-containing protein n=1 Tax=Microvirga sp. VF16 TaxID=2807101 RepID=UPI00193E4C50|nr:LysM peptidoglycan-binding domain-containing protein [Microvirga sp. VF16]QRM28074.1 LysM peptidoglycan-binding domain-containing protein [Microvirga sp. VF16]